MKNKKGYNVLENLMKAIVYEKYGSPDVLELKEIEKPAPGDTDVLIKVHATSVGPTDTHFRSGTPFLARFMAGGLLKPKITILGLDIAGEIESAGKHVRQSKTGDQVYGFVPVRANGATAEYICVPEHHVRPKPANMTMIEAAAVPTSATIALRFLQAGGIQRGQRVLINGASGGIGTFAVQLAKAFGVDVTGVCNTTNLELVRSLGADDVIDYTQKDFTKNGQTYDLIFDTVGKRSFPMCQHSLTRKGIYVTTILTRQILFDMLRTSVIGSKKATFIIPKITIDDLHHVHDLIEAGKVKPVIDRCYPLEQTAEAHRYSEAGHAKGKIIVSAVGKSREIRETVHS
jgi:2-desacetyl-2-hydroxyethyl bacteriochlorophyllide A dehydrogenase